MPCQSTSTRAQEPCRVPGYADHIATAQWWVVLGTISVVPLAFSTWTFDVFNLTALTVLWVGVAVAIGLEIWQLNTKPGWLPRGWHAIAFYMVVLGLTTITSRAPIVSLLGNYGRYGGLVTTIPVITLAYLFAQALGASSKRRTQGLWAVVASGLLGSTYLLAQEFGIDAFAWLEPWSSRPRHPPGALGNSNFSGAHVAMALGPAMVLTTHLRGRARAGLIAAIILLLAGVAVSQSRGAMMGAAAATIVIITMSPRSRRRKLASVAMGGVALAGAIALIANDAGFSELVGTGTAGERLDLWQVALKGAADHPILGGGPDLYSLTFADHAGPGLARVVSDEPHNVLLDQLDGSGLLGAGAWLGVLGAVVWAVRRARLRRAITPWLAMGAAYLAQASVSIDVVPLQLWGWIAAGGVLGLAQARPAWKTARKDGGAHTVRATPVVVGAVATIAIVLLAMAPFRADMAHRRGIEAANTGAHERAITQLTQATERHGWEPRFHRRLGIQLALAGRAQGRSDLTDRARDELSRAIELLPDDTVALEWLSSLDR